MFIVCFYVFFIFINLVGGNSLVVLRWQGGHGLRLLLHLPVGRTLGRYHCGGGGLHWRSHLSCWHGHHDVIPGHHATASAARTTPSQGIGVIKKSSAVVALALDVDIDITNVTHFPRYSV